MTERTTALLLLAIAGLIGWRFLHRRAVRRGQFHLDEQRSRSGDESWSPSMAFTQDSGTYDSGQSDAGLFDGGHSGGAGGGADFGSDSSCDAGGSDGGGSDGGGSDGGGGDGGGGSD